ncbi:hypothetical protein V5O48_015710 [Marasmius crinis-equi]|uniref:Uncharacterized protein n=1 Tax=Marasmius crinis-equi TaxID=585013 RepID=A0ABR3ETS2_9AGAR
MSLTSSSHSSDAPKARQNPLFLASQRPSGSNRQSHKALTTAASASRETSVSSHTSTTAVVGVNGDKNARSHQSQPDQTSSPKKPPRRTLATARRPRRNYLQETQEKLDLVTAQLDDERVAKDDLKAQLEDEISRNTDLSQQREACRRESDSLRRANKRLEGKLKGREDDQKRLEVLEAEREESQSTARMLQNRIKQVLADFATNKKELDSLKAKLEECKSERDTTRAELEKEKRDFTEKQQKWEETRNAVSEAVAISQAHIVQWDGEKKALEVANKEQEATIQELRRNIEARDDEITRLRKSNEAAVHLQTELQKLGIVSDLYLNETREEPELRTSESNQVQVAFTEEHKNVERSEQTARRLQAKIDEQKPQLDNIHAKLEQLALQFADARKSYAGEKVSKAEVLDVCDAMGWRLVALSSLVVEAKGIQDDDSSTTAGPSERPSQAVSKSLSRTSLPKPPPSVSAGQTDPLQLKPTPSLTTPTEPSGAPSASSSSLTPSSPTALSVSKSKSKSTPSESTKKPSDNTTSVASAKAFGSVLTKSELPPMKIIFYKPPASTRPSGGVSTPKLTSSVPARGLNPFQFRRFHPSQFKRAPRQPRAVSGRVTSFQTTEARGLEWLKPKRKRSFLCSSESDEETESVPAVATAKQPSISSVSSNPEESDVSEAPGKGKGKGKRKAKSIIEAMPSSSSLVAPTLQDGGRDDDDDAESQSPSRMRLRRRTNPVCEDSDEEDKDSDIVLRSGRRPRKTQRVEEDLSIGGGVKRRSRWKKTL